MQSKFVLLEGIPGSVRSTAGATLQRFFADNSIPSRFWREGDYDHPADIEGVACLKKSQFEDWIARHPELAERIQAHISIRGDDHLLKYRILQSLSPARMDQSLVDELSRLDVYDGLPMDEYCRFSLDRWRDFYDMAKDTGEVTLMECVYLQNPLTVMLARHDADPQVAHQHIARLTDNIKALNPLVI